MNFLDNFKVLLLFSLERVQEIVVEYKVKRSSQVGYLYHITEELKQGETTQQVDVYLLSFSGNV